MNLDSDCCSEKVQILFSALKSTICEGGEKAYAWQGRHVTDEIIETVSWLSFVHYRVNQPLT